MSHEATNWAIKQRGLKPAAKIVLWHLCDRYHPDHGCFPAQETLAEDCEMSRSSVNNQLAELEASGLIVRIVTRGSNGRRARTRYRLGFEADFPKTPCPEFGHGEDAESMSKNDGLPCPNSGADHVQNLDSNPVREPVREPVTEREARERDDFSDRDGETTADAEADETPKALERRFRALELGSGGKSIAWPGAAGSSSAWGLKQFVALSPEDRRKAEEMRDAYLAICPKVERGPHKGEPKPVALGVYLRDRKFLFAEAMAPKAEPARRIERAAPWGPAWGAKRMALLLEGPAELPARRELRGLFEARFAFFNKTDRAGALRFAEHRGVAVTGDGFAYPDDFEEQELARRTLSGFPAVNALHRAARDRRYETVEPIYDQLAELMEPVPVGGEMWNRWEGWHAAHNLPFVPETGDQRVVFFPKGGPDGLDAFKRAVDAATTTEAAE